MKISEDKFTHGFCGKIKHGRGRESGWLTEENTYIVYFMNILLRLKNCY